MRVFVLALLALTLTGCNAHHLFGPTKPPKPPPEKCYLVISYNGSPQGSIEVPCK